jgi:oligosaccharyltransferase complex subunit beta
LGFVSVATASGGNRVLALLDSLSIKETHSIFFKNLVDLGMDVTFKVADDPSIILKKYGSFLFDHLVSFWRRTIISGLIRLGEFPPLWGDC